MGKRRKIATTIYLQPEQAEQLQALSAITRVPIAVYIRDGIDLVLAAHADELAAQAPAPPIEPEAAS